MQIYRQHKCRARLSQRGAALVVSLILLLIMTIVGVTAMNSARLEVSMAGLVQQEEVVFRGAERTLSAAEVYIEDKKGAFDDAVEGHYLAEEPNLDLSQRDWTSIDRLDDEDIEELAENDTVIVEYMGVMTLPGSVQNEGGDAPIAGEQVKVYRITSRSDTGGKAVRIIESVYTKMYNPMAP
jgi:type IV pilus assembly protein PilX